MFYGEGQVKIMESKSFKCNKCGKISISNSTTDYIICNCGGGAKVIDVNADNNIDFFKDIFKGFK